MYQHSLKTQPENNLYMRSARAHTELVGMVAFASTERFRCEVPLGPTPLLQEFAAN